MEEKNRRNGRTRSSSAKGSKESGHTPAAFDYSVVSLGGTWDPGLPIAASRAGALGLLDLTNLRDPMRARAATTRLLAQGRGKLGLILDASLDASARAALELLTGSEHVVLSPVPGASLSAAIKVCQAKAARIGIVATCQADVEAVAELPVDFVLAKGHEAGGLVGDETAFVLLQRLVRCTKLPLHVWGGIGWHTAAACRIGGAAGVVIDWQFSLLRDSALPLNMKRRVERMDGSETASIRGPMGRWFRVFNQPGFSARPMIEHLNDELRDHPAGAPERWFGQIAQLVGAKSVEDRAWPIGQDACFAAWWNKRFPSVGRAVAALREHVDQVARACMLEPAMAPDSALARSHGTKYPILQGPMTRVSDTAEFIDAVERGGALPVLALALMRGPQARKLMEQTRDIMGKRPWGVGILGFVPRELRDEQMAVIHDILPPFAVIAGGRPDQAASLEARGITTYLHVPSPGMLDTFIKEGARRFIFEGWECGGHVGPRTSFILWDTMIRVILDAKLSDTEAAKIHVLFAGGIHDALSGAMVSAIGQPLVERGMKVGVDIGTAYLYTKEAVSTGAIIERFQEVAMEARDTILVETGPGHAIRCAPTDFYRTFEDEKHRLKKQGLPQEEIREELERHNMGRLRIASKGITRGAKGEVSYEHVDAETQQREGMYMIGQVAAMNKEILTIAELHRRACDEAVELLQQRASSVTIEPQRAPEAPPPCDIAIVGMACLLPGGATDVNRFWDNILASRDAIGEIPPDRFDQARWFDADRTARDRIYSKWGGFLKDLPFDPLKYGIPPAALKSIEPMQLIALEMVDQVLRDAGYLDRNPYKARTSVILGVGGGAAELGASYAFRSMLPQFFTDWQNEELLSQLPEWTEDSFAGILLNVVAGRVSNRFDLGGVNFTVDAACGSSLAAVYLACRELQSGTSDMVVAGGCDTIQNPFGFLCFSKTGALSPGGRSRPFDVSSDGIAISEGHAAVVLKRLADAERDGDKIYAVIRGIAGGSDGRSMGLTAPRPEGQIRTMERAYAQARISPKTLGLYEAHGTGTSVGDQTECNAIKSLLVRENAANQSVAMGGVKSMIGHTKCAAGVVGLIKASMALHRRVLPPTLHVTQPNPKAGFDGGPIYVNSELRPWVRGLYPRRAGVSAFGFGGTNFHAVVEEYTGAAVADDARTAGHALPAELFLFAHSSKAHLAGSIRSFEQEVAKAFKVHPDLSLADLAWTHHHRHPKQTASHTFRAAVVASDVAGLLKHLEGLVTALETNAAKHPVNTFFTDKPAGPDAKIAFLYPGQGSQYPDMLRDLATHFREVSACFETADAALRDAFPHALSALIFPPPMFSDEAHAAAAEALKATNVAQPALGVCNVAMTRMLASFGIRPAMAAGHSYGELVALHAAESIDESALYSLSYRRGDAIVELTRKNVGQELGQMMAVSADKDTTAKHLEGLADAWLANENSPAQTIVSGTKAALAQLAERLTAAKVGHQQIAVACAFHSPLIEPARTTFEQALATVEFRAPVLPVFSNLDAGVYGEKPAEIRAALAEQLVHGVRFVDEVRAMHDAGARVFIEVGPNRVLTKLTNQILRDRPHFAVSTNSRGGSALQHVLQALAALYAQGLHIEMDRLYAGRDLATLDLRALAHDAKKPLSPHLWLVNGSYARPASQPPRQFRLMPLSAPPALPMIGTPAAAHFPSLEVPQTAFETDWTEDTTVSDDPFAQYQATMRQFLKTQESIMRAFLGGGAAPVLPTEPAAAPLQQTAVPPAPRPAPVPAPVAKPAPQLATPKPVAAATATTAVPAQDKLLEIVSERTGYPIDMLNLDANLEADFGIDSIKRVEIVAAFRRAVLPTVTEPPAWFMEQMAAAKSMRAILEGVAKLSGGETKPAAAAPAPAPAAAAVPKAAVPSADDMAHALTGIVSERTGYPADMLNLDANMEADLGIDSIKRVEIVAAFRRAVLPAMTEPPAWFMEQMATAKTMRAILDGVAKLSGSDAKPAAAEAPPTAIPAPAHTTVDLTHSLTSIVSDRTGYPADMLNLDANMEADLGIDSIKRVEIVAAFRRAVLPAMTEPPASFMEQMASAKTMRAILDGVAALAGGGNGAPPQPTAEKKTLRITGTAESSPRCVAVVAESPLPPTEKPSLRPGVYLLTDDGGGVAKSFREVLRLSGAQAEILADADLASREAATAAVKRHSQLAGIVHLTPLRKAPAYPGLDAAAWQNAYAGEIKPLLFLMQAAGDALKAGTASVLSVSIGGGDFGEGRNECAQPWRGGLAGMMKTAAREWTEALFRAIDLDAQPDASALQNLARELTAAGPVEVGYRKGRRLTIRTKRDEFSAETLAKPALALTPGDVLLVTGGARGITAQIVLEMAAHTQATFIILARSAAPSGDEPAATASISDPRELRRTLAQLASKAGEKITPRDLEARAQKIIADREIRATRDGVMAAGGKFEYLACDIRNGQKLAATLADIVQRHGRIDGLVHGAGIIEDKYIADKLPDSFDRVWQTKADSLFALLGQLDPAKLKLVFIFGSVAGFFGNAGQVDYAAANETINRMARRLKDRTPAKVAVVNWGPWVGAGMVTPEVAKQFEERNVGMVTVPGGRSAAWKEIIGPAGGDVRALVGPGVWVDVTADISVSPAAHASSTPLLSGQQVKRTDKGFVEARVTLDPAKQVFLSDHVIDGKSVLPMAVAMELMTETAAAAEPAWHVARVEQVRLFNGILVENKRDILITAEPVKRDASGGEWKVRLADAPSGRPAYQATVHLTAKAPVAPAAPAIARIGQAFDVSVPDAYRRWLFHGPLFQVIDTFSGADKTGMDAKIRPSSPAHATGNGAGTGWLIDPAVIDAGPQLAMIWSRWSQDIAMLPNAIHCYHRYGPIGRDPVEAVFRVQPGTDRQSYKADIWYLRDGKVVGRLEGVEGSGSAELNRIAEKSLT